MKPLKYVCHKIAFPEQKVNFNAAHFGPANNTSNCLDGLLSLIKVTAGAWVCPTPTRYFSHQWVTGKKTGRKGLTGITPAAVLP